MLIAENLPIALTIVDDEEFATGYTRPFWHKLVPCPEKSKYMASLTIAIAANYEKPLELGIEK